MTGTPDEVRAPMHIEDHIAEVLATARRGWVYCACGWASEETSTPGIATMMWAEHLADIARKDADEPASTIPASHQES